jgi:hypothetical protein
MPCLQPSSSASSSNTPAYSCSGKDISSESQRGLHEEDGKCKTTTATCALVMMIDGLENYSDTEHFIDQTMLCRR